MRGGLKRVDVFGLAGHQEREIANTGAKIVTYEPRSNESVDSQLCFQFITAANVRVRDVLAHHELDAFKWSRLDLHDVAIKADNSSKCLPGKSAQILVFVDPPF